MSNLRIAFGAPFLTVAGNAAFEGHLPDLDDLEPEQPCKQTLIRHAERDLKFDLVKVLEVIETTVGGQRQDVRPRQLGVQRLDPETPIGIGEFECAVNYAKAGLILGRFDFEDARGVGIELACKPQPFQR